MKTVLLLSGIPYNFGKQRPQHMADFFSGKGYKILYLGFGEKSEFLSEDELEKLTINDLLHNYSTQVKNNLFILKRILISDSKRKKSLEYLIAKICTIFNANDLTVFAAHPDWIDHLDLLPPDINFVYDCIDDWEGFAKDLNLGINENITNNERRIAGISDLVLTSAKRLYAKMSTYNNNVYFLPNGAWNKDYKLNCNKPLPSDLKDIANPIIFFMGGIAGWVDLKLIEFLSLKRPHYSFVFVGDLVNCKLPQEKNIHFLGKKKYYELSLYLKNSRVAIIPFKETNLTASVTPLKYYEYMSAGIPVVSTMLPDLVHLSGSLIVQNYQEFLEAIDLYVDLEDNDYKNASLLAINTSEKFDWNLLLEPLCHYIEQNDKFLVPNKHRVFEETISNYELFSKNNTIKNELISFYNLQNEYKKTVAIYSYKELLDGSLSTDYNQLALAYFMIGEVEKSIEIFKIYVQKSKKLLNNFKYINSLIVDEKILFKLFLLKNCGRQYEVLKIIDSKDLNPKIAGILSGIYFELGEKNLAIEYAITAINNLENLEIDDVLDPYCIVDLIDSLIYLEEYGLAEQISLIVLHKGEELEDIAIKRLGDIYFQINSPKEI